MDAETIKLCKDLGLKRKEAIDFCREICERREKEKKEEKEREALEREKERAHELKILELQNNRNNRRVENLELAPFIDGEDDIYRYVEDFEYCAQNNGWNPSYWAMYLATLLTVRALGVYARMPRNEANDYFKLKCALLPKFHNTKVKCYSDDKVNFGKELVKLRIPESISLENKVIEIEKQISSSQVLPMKGENSFTQPESSAEREEPSSQDLPILSTSPKWERNEDKASTLSEALVEQDEREVTSSRDISIPPTLSKQEENEDEVFSRSNKFEHTGTPIPKWESVDSREIEEEDCYDEITISSGKELRYEQPKVASSFDTTTISTTITTTTATSEECSFVPASMLVNSHDVTFIEKKKDLEKMASELIKTNKSEGGKKSEGGEDDDYEEEEASDNSVTSSDNYEQIKERIVIKSEVENSSKDGASIIERRRLGTIQSKNPISALNELYLRLEYKEICKSSLPHDLTFTIALEINSQHFEISGRSKKHTKHLTTESTLRYLVQFRIENEVVQALGSNCPKKVEFVGDSSTCNIGSSPEFKESVQRASFNKQGKDGSGRSKEQKATPSQTVKNPIMLLNELRKGVEYKTLEESSDLQCFEGTRSKKKLSKTVAAKEVLSKLFSLIIQSPMDLQYVPLTSHLNFHMPKNLADKIVKSVCEKLFFLTSEKPTPARRKIQRTKQYKYRRKGKVKTRRYQVTRKRPRIQNF